MNNDNDNEDIKERQNQKYLKMNIKQNKSNKRQYSLTIIAFIIFFILFLISGEVIFLILSIISVLGIIRTYSYLSEWKNISGPKYKSMDQGYEFDIITKLLPKFEEYGLTVPLSPVRKEPGMLHFVMYNKDYDKISLDFYNVHEDITNENKYKTPLLVKVSYFKYYSPKEEKEKHEFYKKDLYNKEVGEIDLSTNENVDKAFNLIISVLNEDE